MPGVRHRVHLYGRNDHVSRILAAFADEFATFGKRVVTVAYFEDGDYMSTDEEGRYVGYNIEYLNEIARYADWTYEYVKYPSWEEACAALEASKVDLLPMVYYTEDRERRMIFSHHRSARFPPRST